MNRHAHAVVFAVFALAGWVGAATVVLAGDDADLAALGAGATVADDRLAGIAGRQSQEQIKIVVPFGEQPGGTVVGFAAETMTVYGLPVVGPRPGPAIGVAGFGVLGTAYRPNF